MESATRPSINKPVVFSCLGHVYVHCFTAFYFVIVLAVEQDWQLPYHQLIQLWTLGAALVGVIALPAGWLADRWSARGMMIVYFVGMGVSTMAAGFSPAPYALLIALASLGAFAAIYHPVGIPWLIRNSPRDRRGRVLAVNGIFGGIGSAMAGISAGVLIELAGWRSAFIVPGVICLLTGLVLAMSGDSTSSSHPTTSDAPAPEKPLVSDMRRVFAVLLLTMFISGIVYHCLQTILPKLLEQRHGAVIDGSPSQIGAVVAGIYLVAGAMQLVGGYLADRWSLKPIYVIGFLIQVPLLWVLTAFTGVALVLTITLMMMALYCVLPAENLMLAHYSPDRRHGLVFGLKFVLAFGAAPIAVQVVSAVTGVSNDVSSLFNLLTILVATITLIALALPDTHVASLATPKQ